MPSKFCLGCKQLFKVEDGLVSRCAPCQAGLIERINARPKPNTTQRGLGHAHRVRARAVLAAAQVCALCGEPPRQGDPLTADHTTPRSQGGQASPLRAVHRSCNSRAGGQQRS